MDIPRQRVALMDSQLPFMLLTAIKSKVSSKLKEIAVKISVKHWAYDRELLVWSSKTYLNI